LENNICGENIAMTGSCCAYELPRVKREPSLAMRWSVDTELLVVFYATSVTGKITNIQ